MNITPQERDAQWAHGNLHLYYATWFTLLPMRSPVTDRHIIHRLLNYI